MSVLEVRLGTLLAAHRAGTITPEAEAEIENIAQTLTRPMPPHPPFCVLMAGLPGSGKTTLSRALTARGSQGEDAVSEQGVRRPSLSQVNLQIE
ncbi:zeta toxin family protein [Streptomyces tauricus]|uniref:zeta toxin family protein n=1 Tax=Streptomyces tauricus TaxID=68274 RepID=UPI0033B5468E